MLFVKENAFGKNPIQIDIRKCMEYEDKDEVYIYSKQGVRLTPVQSVLLLNELKKEILHATRAKGYEGCIEDKHSQKDHNGMYGCWAEWADIVFLRISNFSLDRLDLYGDLIILLILAYMTV